MEWPSLEFQSDLLNCIENDEILSHSSQVLSDRFLSDLASSIVTKEIYARAASAALASDTSRIVARKSNAGENELSEKMVVAFLDKLRTSASDSDEWHAYQYRETARDVTELMASLDPLATLKFCKGGLDAVHDLLKYRLPSSSSSDSPTDGSAALLNAKDAYVLSQSFPKLDADSVTGTRAPDLEFRFGLLHNNSKVNSNSNVDCDVNSLYGMEACDIVNALHQDGTMETSAASLAKNTLANPNLVAQLSASKTTNSTGENQTETIFVVLGCDHPMSPAKPLLRIPGVKVLGIPSSEEGLEDILDYVRYNSPDDTTFVHPSWNQKDKKGNYHRKRNRTGNNLILSRGPQVAQWLIDHAILAKKDGDEIATDSKASANCRKKLKLVLVPMAMPLLPPANTSRNSDSPFAFVPEASVRWAASSDLIVQRVVMAAEAASTTFRQIQCSLWSYQSSSTCMVVPPTSTTLSTELLHKRPSHEQWLHTLSMGTVLTPTIEEDNNRNKLHKHHTEQQDDHSRSTAVPSGSSESDIEANTVRNSFVGAVSNTNHNYSIVNGIVTSEGPHHMLSEHIRLWRAMITHYSADLENNSSQNYLGDYDSDSDDDDDGIQRKNSVHVFAPHVPIVSRGLLTEAIEKASPSTPKISAARPNKITAPLQILNSGTMASLMAAIALAGFTDPLINQPMPMGLIDEKDANTAEATIITTPFCLFWNGSVHSGVWNCPYTLDSIFGTVGYFLEKVYGYCDSALAAASSAIAIANANAAVSGLWNKNSNDTQNIEQRITTNTKSTEAAKSGGDNKFNYANNDDHCNTSIVDMVPSIMRDEERQDQQLMPNLVKDRLEILA